MGWELREMRNGREVARYGLHTPVTIGRSGDNTIVIGESHYVSKRHAEIRRQGSRYELVDHSRNGVFVDGEKVDKRRVLASEAVITLPGITTWALRFCEADATQLTEPATGGLLVLNRRTREATLNGQPLRLRPKEFEALALLDQHQGALVTKETLIRALWPNELIISREDSLNTLLSGLRNRLKEVPLPAGHRCAIITVPRTGYHLVDQAAAEADDHAGHPD